MNEFFFRLTPERVLEGVEECGFIPSGHCQALNSLENRVYDVRLEDGRHVVIKFYRPGRWNRLQLNEEHRFLEELRDHEIPVCVPLTFPDGESVHLMEDIFFAVWPRTGGRAPDEFSDGQLRILGRLLARIHNVGSSGAYENRVRLDVDNYIERPLELLRQNGFLPPYLRERYCRSAREAARVYEELSGDVPFLRIHGDCHPGNLLNGREGWFFLDFDDTLCGPAVQDFWMLLPFTATGEVKTGIFLEAYRQFRDFDNAWLRLINPLRALRYIHYAAWIARRWEDPAFPAAFPHFGTEEYWEKETRDLEELVNLFGEDTVDPVEVGRGQQEQKDGEMTNKDFFWDWEGD